VIYLDHHAASPMDVEVSAAMAEASARGWANPSSVHAAGRASRAILERARDQVAGAIGARASDVVFTSGGTEAVNLGVLGLGAGARRVVTTAIEHPSLLGAVSLLERDGAEVIRLGVRDGCPPSEQELERALDGSDLACLAWVNHETGTILPLHEVAERCRERGVPLVVDATAALGKIEVDVGRLGASAVAIASSKIGGPPATGALWITREAPLAPRMLGGGQERGRRAGTPDPVALAGFGAACARIGARLASMADVGRRRDRLEAALVARAAVVNGAAGPRVATVTNVSVPGWRGTGLVAALDLEGLCASSGAACSSGVDEPSRVIAAMLPDAPWRAESALRLSLGPSTTDQDVDGAIAILERVLSRKRA
jgi:cysteine desulfurase